MKKVFFNILFLAVAVVAFGQKMEKNTPFDRTKNQLDGFSMGIGAMQSSFFSSVFQKNVAAGDAKAKPGLAVSVRYTLFPLLFNLDLFGSNFQFDEFDGQKPSGGVTVRHTGAEIGASVGLFHFSKTVVPFVGAGYQKGILGSGILFVGVPDSDKKDILSVADVSTPVFKCGLDVHTKWLGGRVEYRRGLSKERGFNQFSILVTGKSLK